MDSIVLNYFFVKSAMNTFFYVLGYNILFTHLKV